MRRGPLFLVCLLAVVTLTACGSPARDTGGPSSKALPPTVSAPATLLPDGTVPWVDEPAGEKEFSLPPPVRRVDPNAKPCRASDLRGELTNWITPGDSGEPGVPKREPPKLYGFARVTNTGQQTCRLHGEVDTRLRDHTGELKIGYSHGVDQEGRQRVTIVPPGESADLRLDWSAPFCAPHDGPLELEINLPENGGKLRAPITATTAPPCGRPSETHPEITSFLASSVFDEPAKDTPMDSQLAALTATIEGAITAKPGDLVTYHVRLNNPTAAAIPLDPCPGYLQERFSPGTAELRAINEGTFYRLNCRPVHSIPANGSIRFAIGVPIPIELTTARQLTVTWRMIAPNLASGPWGTFTLTAA